MLRLACMTAAVALLLSWDVSGVARTQPPDEQVKFASGESPQISQDTPQDNKQTNTQSDAPRATRHINIPKDDADQPAAAPTKAIDGPLQPASRLALVRFVSGEYARAEQPLPAGKNGFHLKAGVPLSDQQLRMALGSSGAAVNPGDQAQITSLEFKEREIVVDVNGGGRGKKKLRDRIHLEIGGVPSVSTVGPDTPVNTNAGATIYLDFDKPLPDMTPDDLKQYLSQVLDFSKQHSAAVQWVDSLPPEIQTAITEKRPIVGMDHDMVLAAMGRPDRKVRERNSDGDEIEDWIYGKPPAKTVFVEFEGDKVTQVKQYPQ